jgi:hypothetical protein
MPTSYNVVEMLMTLLAGFLKKQTCMQLFTRSTDLSLIGLVNATGLDAAETLLNELSPRPTQSTRGDFSLTYEA